MVGLTTETYVPKLRSKLGEQVGYGHLSLGARTHTKVQWVIPSRSQKDVEENRHLNADEYVRLNGRRIGLVSFGCPCFADAKYALQGFPEDETGTSIVTLFRAIRDATGQASPVIDFTSVTPTLASAFAQVLKQQNFGAAIRLDAEAMQEDDISRRLRTLLQLLDIRSSAVTLMLDFADSDLMDDDDTAALVESAMERSSLGLEWNGVVFQATSYPATNPARKNELVTRPRNEFALWRRIKGRSKNPKGELIFGDYGADSASFESDGAGRPSPHLRSSSDLHWIISKGDREADRATTMRAVAKRIAERDDFRGDGFSWGDSRTVDIAAGDPATGNPTTWRSMNTAHHLERTCRDIGTALGFTLPEYSRVRRNEQLGLFQ